MKAKLDHATMQIVMARGRKYKPAALPADLKFGRLEHCFDESIKSVFAHPEKYRYVEGIASDPENPNHLILHAWVTDEAGVNAYDPTWRVVDKRGRIKRIALPSTYFGIDMGMLDVVAFMRITGNQGILANRDLAPDDFARIFPHLVL